MLNITAIAAVLKKVIVPEIQSEIAKMSVLLDKVEKNVGVSIANNNIYVATRVGRHSGIYAMAEGSNPPTGNAKYAQPYAPMKYMFGTLEITDQAIEAAKKGDTKAVASALAMEIDALKNDFRLDINRMLNGAGAGKLCQTNGTGAAATALLVDTNPNGGDANEYLAEGMYIQIGTGSSVQISALVGSTGATLAASTTWADDTVITKYGADEPMGLAGIIDDGDNVATIQNITRATNVWANSFTYDTGATLTEANMISMYLKARRHGQTNVILTGEALYGKFGALLTGMKKTADLKEILSGGWRGLEFMDGVGVMLDYDCWSGYVQFVNFKALTLAQMSEPFDWLEADAYGGVLRRSPTNRTVWEGTLKYYFNLIGLKFKALARMSAQTV